MFSKELKQSIERNPYCKEWRRETALSLYSIGMPEEGIIAAIEGKLDDKICCYNYCIEHHLPSFRVWQILK